MTPAPCTPRSAASELCAEAQRHIRLLPPGRPRDHLVVRLARVLALDDSDAALDPATDVALDAHRAFEALVLLDLGGVIARRCRREPRFVDASWICERGLRGVRFAGHVYTFDVAERRFFAWFDPRRFCDERVIVPATAAIATPIAAVRAAIP